MKAWRLLMILAVAAALSFAEGAPPGWGRSSPLAAQAPVTPLAPGQGEETSGSVVHSWALAPTVLDPSRGGSRPNLSYEVVPGGEVKDEVTLFNYSNVQLTFRLYATDALNNEDGSFDLLPGDQKPTGVGTWVTLPQENITLGPRSQATMPITVKVPSAALPGDHAGGILASSRAEGTGPNGKVIALDRRTGSRIYVRVAGKLVPELTVERVRISYQPGLSPLGGTAKITYRVENRGNIRMGGKQRVSVSGPFGLARKRKAAVDLPELLPGEGVTLRATFKDVAATVVAVAKIQLDPVPVDKRVEDVPRNSGRSVAPAVPFSVLALVLAIWLLRRARRSYLRHQIEDSVTGERDEVVTPAQ